MQLVRLGDSGLMVSRLALGTATWGTQVDEYGATELLAAFLEAGGSLLESSGQGDPHAHAFVGRVLARTGAREQLVVAATAGRRGTSRRSLLDELDRTLRDLGTDHVDLWQVARLDGSAPIAETMAALDGAVRTGKARYAGVCNTSGWQTALAHARFEALGGGVPLVSAQVEYSLLNRTAERELLPAARHVGMGVLAWAPLGRGVLTGKYRDRVPADSRAADDRWAPIVRPYLLPARQRIVDAVIRAADGLGLSPAQAALAWARDMPGVAALIVGARTVVQLHESLASEAVSLPGEIHDALTDVSEAVR